MVLKKVYVMLLVLLALSTKAQQSIEFNLRNLFQIGDFELVKEEGKSLSIAATDVENKYPEKINGLRRFTINGIIEHPEFHKGRASLAERWKDTNILFLKHTNDRGLSTYRLFYQTQSEVYNIPLWFIPVSLLLFIVVLSLIRKLLFIAAIVLFVLFFWINGMDMNTFWDMFKNALRAFF